MESNNERKVARGLKVDNDVRQYLLKTMKAKTRFAWLMFFVSVVWVFSPYLFLTLHIPGGNIMYFSIPVSVMFLIVCIVTLKSARKLRDSLQIGNQSAFDEALSKWNMRGMLAFGGYILLVILVAVLTIGPVLRS